MLFEVTALSRLHTLRRMESVTFSAKDGVPLSGMIYQPDSALKPQTQPRGALLLVCAMGVPQSFYRAFCEWLAECGFVAMTFDYRGMGQSRHGSLRGLEADVMTWAELDTPAALEYLAVRVPDVPIGWIGHSLGGQIYAFAMNRADPTTAARVKKFNYIAAGSGYWRENALPTRRRSWLFWFVLGPVLTPILGYWPGAKLGIVGDLPKGVFYQWKRWCMNREYAVGALPAKYRALAASVAVPITAVSFTDDEMMSERNIASLQSIYPQQAFRAIRLSPQKLGVKRVGHFGAFRREMRDALWIPLILPELSLDAT
jgi:predicted alpha/beta hydrolase